MIKRFCRKTTAVLLAVMICVTFIPCIAFGETVQEETPVVTDNQITNSQDETITDSETTEEVVSDEAVQLAEIPEGWNETKTRYYDSAIGDYVKGARSIDGALYFFDNNGNLYKRKGSFSYNGKKYYGNGNGTLRVGYFKIGKYYYGYSPVYGNMQFGAATIYNKPYYFDSKGHGKKKGWIGKTYYSLGNGKLKTGYCRLKQGKKRYYFFLNYKTGAITKGYLYSGSPYYFYSNGHGMSKGWLSYGSNSYYCKGNGILATGYNKVGSYYYGFNPVNDSTGRSAGAMLKGGMFDIGSGKYLFNANGRGAGAQWLNREDGRYYCKGNGVMAKGYTKIGSDGYWFGTRAGVPTFTYNPDHGEAFDVKYGGQIYRFDGEFKGLPAGWIDNNTRYCKGAGLLATGWTAMSNKAYYFNKTDAVKVSGKYVIGNKISDTKSDYAGIYIDSKGYIDGQRGEAYARAINCLNRRGWSLRAAFNYAAKIKYYGRYKFTKGTGIAYNAAYGFRTGKGNCYVMADTFYCMAKLMGYDVRAIGGTVGPTHPHSWTIIKQNGSWRVYDPNFSNETRYSGWNIYYGKKRTWKYAHRDRYMDIF